MLLPMNAADTYAVKAFDFLFLVYDRRM